MKYNIICFGEILWDIFPDKKIIGGAPLNVALRLHSFDIATAMVSCIGNDANGADVSGYLMKKDLNQTYIQRHPHLKTGEVLITLDSNKNASYEISRPVAWDIIALTNELVALVKETPIFLFGSLALRGTHNIATMDVLLKEANTAVFDVNLRAPHYDIDLVYELMQRSDVVKMNDDELIEICTALGCETKGMKEQVAWLAAVSATKIICVTRGAKGACLYLDGVWHSHLGYKVDVIDTVGAGDSFFASLIQSLLIDKISPDTALARSCALGALVASKGGANCEVLEVEIEEMME